jgi:LmbE family N-acetylglucosaminyl deacetylase
VASCPGNAQRATRNQRRALRKRIKDVRTFLIAVMLCLPALARTRAVRHPGAIPSPASVMWIASHPDDEAVAAPLLSEWCRVQGARCTFLVMTRGEAGTCLLPNGCAPDVASVRSAEAGAASQYFQATSILLTFRDGGGVMPPEWRASSNDLAGTIAKYIKAARPDLILTFDPRHGSTCHPDHRETGSLVLEAVRRPAYSPALYLLETRVTFSADPFRIRFTPAFSEAARYDATGTWDAIIEDMRRHPSQFDEAAITAIRQMPLEERAVYIISAADVLDEEIAFCP